MLLAAVLAQRLHGEWWQGEDGAAGCGLERPNRQLPAAATSPCATVATGVSREDGGVDDGEGLAELDSAGVQVWVGPFQAHSSPLRAPVAAARTVQAPSHGLEMWPAASRSIATCSGASAATSVRGTGGGVA